MYNLLKQYKEISATNNYFVPYEENGKIYVSLLSEKYLIFIASLDKTKMGLKRIVLMHHANDKQVIKQLTTPLFYLCKRKEIEQEAKTSKYNKGEIFEKKIFEHFNMVWEKDNTPFFVAGDIDIGVEIQIKYYNSTLCDEYTVHREIERRKAH